MSWWRCCARAVVFGVRAFPCVRGGFAMGGLMGRAGGARGLGGYSFRDAAATSVAIEDPVHVGIVAAILGHSTFGTAEQYYNQATSLEAARKYQATVRAYRA